MEPFNPRLEENLRGNEGSQAGARGWAASGLDPSGGAGDGGKSLDVASPGHGTSLYLLHLRLESAPI